MKARKLILALALSTTLSLPTLADPAGTVISYQGRLESSGAPAQGSYDFRFSLNDAPSGGNPVGPGLKRNGVPVTNGLFSVELDFGPGVFTGRHFG